MVLTGLDSDDVALAALREGAQDYLAKGALDGPLLNRTLRHAVERGRLERELTAREHRWRALLQHSADVIALIGADRRLRYVGEQRRANQRIAFQASLLEQVRNAVIATDLEGRVSYWNAAAERVYGWSAEAATGRPVAELNVPSDARQETGTILETIVRTGRWEGEFTACDATGRVFPTETSLTPLRDGEEVVGFVGVSSDISERKRRETERQRLVHDLGERVKELRLLHQSAVALQDETAAQRAEARAASGHDPFGT